MNSGGNGKFPKLLCCFSSSNNSNNRVYYWSCWSCNSSCRCCCWSSFNSSILVKMLVNNEKNLLTKSPVLSNSCHHCFIVAFYNKANPQLKSSSWGKENNVLLNTYLILVTNVVMRCLYIITTLYCSTSSCVSLAYTLLLCFLLTQTLPNWWIPTHLNVVTFPPYNEGGWVHPNWLICHKTQPTNWTVCMHTYIIKSLAEFHSLVFIVNLIYMIMIHYWTKCLDKESNESVQKLDGWPFRNSSKHKQFDAYINFQIHRT